jgi:hypothetical protein
MIARAHWSLPVEGSCFFELAFVVFVVFPAVSVGPAVVGVTALWLALGVLELEPDDEELELLELESLEPFELDCDWPPLD